jgi:hypothetical protein
MRSMASALGITAMLLILASHSAGAFLGISFEQLPFDEFGNILTYRIYAQFDGTQGTSGNDLVFGVADCDPGAPLLVLVQGGTFFQHPANTHAGGDLSPDPLSCQNEPAVCRDTFVTVGKLTAVDDETMLSFGWPGFGPDVLEVENGGWTINPVKNPEQGTPGLADNPPDRVVLMQLSTTDGVGFVGAMLVGMQSDGMLLLDCVTFNTGCFADTDGDNAVGIDDFLTVLEQWGPCPAKCPGDVTANETVDIVDFLEVLARWGPCP